MLEDKVERNWEQVIIKIFTLKSNRYMLIYKTYLSTQTEMKLGTERNVLKKLTLKVRKCWDYRTNTVKKNSFRYGYLEWSREILYPVGDRTEDTLLPIIQRHVEGGSTIYSDGWSLNDIGYEQLHTSTLSRKHILTRRHVRRWMYIQPESREHGNTQRTTSRGCQERRLTSLRDTWQR